MVRVIPVFHFLIYIFSFSVSNLCVILDSNLSHFLFPVLVLMNMSSLNKLFSGRKRESLGPDLQKILR